MQSNISDIFQRYHKVMLYVAARILGNQTLAEDAVQNAFLKIVKHPQHVLSIPIDELKPYLIVVSENSARTLYRKINKIEETSLDEVDLVSDSSPENLVISRMNLTSIFNMPQLNSQYRDVIILKYYYDFSNKEIAIALDISEVNVRVRLSRAKSLIKRALSCGGVKE